MSELTREKVTVILKRNIFGATPKDIDRLLHLWDLYHEYRGTYTKGHCLFGATELEVIYVFCIEHNDCYINNLRLRASSDRKIWRMFHKKGHLTDKDLKKELNRINRELRKVSKTPDAFDDEMMALATIDLDASSDGQTLKGQQARSGETGVGCSRKDEVVGESTKCRAKAGAYKSGGNP